MSDVMPLPSQVDNKAVATFGTTREDGRGNEYIYLPGAASLAAGDFVVYNPTTFAITRAVAASRGPGGFAGGAPTAQQCGWFQIRGYNPGATANGAIAANAAVGVSATPGSIGPSAAAQKIENVFATGALAAGKAPIFIAAPPVAGGLG